MLLGLRLALCLPKGPSPDILVKVVRVLDEDARAREKGHQILKRSMRPVGSRGLGATTAYRTTGVSDLGEDAGDKWLG